MEIFDFEIDFWILLGLFGQFLFFLRFVTQWIVSEREGKSIIPVYFWYLSIAGAIIILVYAIYRSDPVFILGQGFALLIYMRNLVLVHKRRVQKEI